MLTETGVVVVSAIVILTAFASFILGLFTRRRSDAELIAQLEEELDRRQLVMPQEVAHEPAEDPDELFALAAAVTGPPPLPPGARLVTAAAARQGTDDTQWDMTPVPDMGLEIWTARMTVSNEQFLARLFG